MRLGSWVFFLLFALQLQASEWQISSTAGVPGASVPLTLSFSGNGQINAAQIDIIFDESRLKLPFTNYQTALSFRWTEWRYRG